MIDMSADAVARRLRAWSELSASSTRAPRVDMSARAVEDRLRMQAGLSTMCLALGKAHRVGDRASRSRA